MDKIDFVLTWVDGEDPRWQAQRRKYDPDFSAAGAAHYRDYGTLRYWFRAVEKYAPWVNRIHFVTCGQRPAWLNTAHPKLHLVDHGDFMPAECLPTFSINPIELNLHRIEGLAEQFVYFNDDTFLVAPVCPKDFFQKGLPCDSFALSALVPSVKNEVITYILFNDLLLLNANINKRQEISRHLTKWLSPKFGKNIFRNLYYMPIGKFSGFVNPHLPNSFLKSTFEAVWDAEGEVLSAVCRNRFRTKEDVNQYLMRYWQLAKGTFVPRSQNVGKCFTLGQDDAWIRKTLQDQSTKLLCINDDPLSMNIEKQMQELISQFSELLGESCSFEV